MSEKLETFKKKLLYRASYRGTKEMDILLKTFVNRHMDVLNFYNFNIIDKNIDKNLVSKIFKKFKI